MNDVTDIHAHVFPDVIAKKATESIGQFYDLPPQRCGTVEQLLHTSGRAGITRSCIYSVAVTPHSIDSINRFVAASVKEHPDRLTGYGAVHPDRENIPGLAEEVRAMGLKGLKIHPDMQKFALDSPAAMEMFAAIEGKLPIVIHTGDPRFEYSHPKQMKKVLDAFPKLVCVCAHLGGWKEWEDAWTILAGYENAYVDTSSSLYLMSPAEGRRLIRRFSRERVLFGTDFPMWDPEEEMERFRALKLTDDEEERILSLNARPLIS